MATLTKQIAAYGKLRDKLEAEHHGKWVVFHDSELEGVYETLEDAAVDAVRKFGRGPYLIREVGAPQFQLPASVLYRPANADR